MKDRPQSKGSTSRRSSGKSNVAEVAISPLPIDAVNKSEHVPPIIIKGSSFFVDCEFQWGAPTGGANPPYTHRYPYPFPMRGIRVMASPFGTPETLYYCPDPTGFSVDLTMRGAATYNVRIASVLFNGSRVLELTTLDHRLPTRSASGDPYRPHRYAYATDNSLQLSHVKVISASGQMLFQTEVLQPSCYVGIWRSH